MKRFVKLVFLSLLIAMALVLSIVESFIPLPFIAPGIKLGLSNIIGLIVIVLFGFKEALIVAIVKSFTFALGTGNFSGLMYSLAGGTISVISMYLVYRYLAKYFSLIGVSIVGAVFHNVGQLLVASLIMENMKIFTYLPMMNFVSLFTGYFIGLSASYLSTNLQKTFFTVASTKDKG